MEPKVVITAWIILTLAKLSTAVLSPQEDGRVIIIDQDGTSGVECCVNGTCVIHCSNLSLALQHITDNTEIKILSNIPLNRIVQFGNVSNITITGHSNPTVMCDHQGGLVGSNINHIVIQKITWDGCYATMLVNFEDALITECTFQNHDSYCITIKGHGLLHINYSNFSGNTGGIDISVPHVNYSSNHDKVLHANLEVSEALNVVIIGCNFINNSGYSVKCLGSDEWLSNITVLSSGFYNNTNTAVNIAKCNISLSDNTTFYNNVIINGRNSSNGAAIRSSYGTVNTTGTVLFHNNIASYNGGGVFLDHSQMFNFKGPTVFCNNSAKSGGAIYISKGSKLYASKASLKFVSNTASFYGDTVFVEVYYIRPDICHQSIIYYYLLLVNAAIISTEGNSAIKRNNYAYFSIRWADTYDSMKLCKSSTPLKYKSLFSSSLYELRNFDSTTANVHMADCHDSSNGFERRCNFLINNLQIIPLDYFGNHVGGFNVTISISCDQWQDSFPPHMTTNTLYNVSIGNNTSISITNVTVFCYFHDIGYNGKVKLRFVVSDHMNLLMNKSVNILVMENCNDIAHFYPDANNCHLLSCNETDLPAGILCSSDPVDLFFSTALGYWFQNGFQCYVKSCPSGYCDPYFDLYYAIFNGNTSPTQKFPDSDAQCTLHWHGFACGECDQKDNLSVSIVYDTKNCTLSSHCIHTSYVVNFVLLFSTSLLYWIAVLSFIFVLLHFKFDFTAGYAYGIIFYYSILEQLMDAYIANNSFTVLDIYYPPLTVSNEVLPFLSSIGNLKPPFLKYLKLCFPSLIMMDYIFLMYIHPIIVTCLVVVIFLSARNFVTVARLVGRYVNSKSICILLLLAYSSVSYISVQLLRPLAVFEHQYGPDAAVEWRTYLSPAVHYFRDRHKVYGIIAILCEIIIGIGFPLVLIFQRYLVRYFNINFASSTLVLDQLKGCYKEEYRWFAAYYLICRQVINIIDIVFDFIFISIASEKYLVMLLACVFFVAFHVWFQPYKRKGLNILDSIMLFNLVFLLISGLDESGLDESGWDDSITMTLWTLPLLFLINYLAYPTKLKYVLIPGSCIGVLCMVSMLTAYINIFHVLLAVGPCIILVAFVIFAIKQLCTFVRSRNAGYSPVAINEQDDDSIEDSD